MTTPIAVPPDSLIAATDTPPWKSLFDSVMEAAQSPPDPYLRLRQGGDELVFDARRIGRLYADTKYVCFQSDGAEQLLNRSLLSLEQQLQSFGFMRIRRNELVNLHTIVRVRRRGRVLHLQLTDGQRLAVSRRLTRFVIARLKQISSNTTRQQTGLQAANTV